MTVTIYHNPACGTSRNTLAMIRATGTEPKVIEYSATPLKREELCSLIERMGIRPRCPLRNKGSPDEELNLGDPSHTDGQLIDAMMEHPILINRPIVAGPGGVKLCRPSEEVLSVLDRPLPADFTKEDGEVVPANG